MNEVKIAIFASGSGTNAENLVRYFSTHAYIRVHVILTNNPKAGVIERMKLFNLPCIVFSRSDLYENGEVLRILRNYQIDFIVLAGFLWMMPKEILSVFDKKIVNIHPALLPKYGGKGMYGMKVHEAVRRAGDLETGITIHYVNEKYDEGEIIFQTRCRIDPLHDSAEKIAEKVHQLEYRHYPEVIENLIQKNIIP